VLAILITVVKQVKKIGQHLTSLHTRVKWNFLTHKGQWASFFASFCANVFACMFT